MATQVSHPINVNEFLSKKQSEASNELATEWAQLEELHNKK